MGSSTKRLLEMGLLLRILLLLSNCFWTCSGLESRLPDEARSLVHVLSAPPELFLPQLRPSWPCLASRDAVCWVVLKDVLRRLGHVPGHIWHLGTLYVG